MISAELAMHDLKLIRESDPELALKFLGIDLLSTQTVSELGLAVDKKEKVEDEESTSILQYKKVAEIMTKVITSIFGIVSSAVGIVARLLVNPYVLGGLVIAGGALTLYKLITHRAETYENPDYVNPKIHDYSKYIKESSVLDAVVKGAEIVGVDPKLMLQIVKAESAFGVNTRQTKSTAKGIFQIIDSTWDSHYPSFNKRYGIPVNSPLDPLSASIFSAAYVKHVLAPIRNNSISATDVYLMYVFGPGGGANLLREMDKNPNQYSAIVQARKDYGPGQIKANESYFFNKDGSMKTLAQTYAMAKSRVTFTPNERFIIDNRYPDLKLEPETIDNEQSQSEPIAMQNKQTMPVNYKGVSWGIRE